MTFTKTAQTPAAAANTTSDSRSVFAQIFVSESVFAQIFVSGSVFAQIFVSGSVFAQIFVSGSGSGKNTQLFLPQSTPAFRIRGRLRIHGHLWVLGYCRVDRRSPRQQPRNTKLEAPLRTVNGNITIW